MPKSKFKKILITGASGAVGGALARHYSEAGVTLILHGRNVELLAKIAEECRTAGALVEKLVLDLRDITELRNWIMLNLEQTPPDLVIANAGMSINNHPQTGENWDELAALIDLNVKSTLALVNGVIPAMRARGSGQIVLISSLAAYYGLPVTPGYSASKAALKAYAEALRCDLAPAGVKVNLVMPGDIKSAMCAATDGPKFLLMDPDKASIKIARGIKKNQARISFPFPLNLGAWFLAVMPAACSDFFLKALGYGAK